MTAMSMILVVVVVAVIAVVVAVVIIPMKGPLLLSMISISQSPTQSLAVVTMKKKLWLTI
jgi:hypothetical protein